VMPRDCAHTFVVTLPTAALEEMRRSDQGGPWFLF
jgi:hypothetical protein